MHGSADLVFVNGSIYTVDAVGRWALPGGWRT